MITPIRENPKKLTQERVCVLFNYMDGELFWKVRRSGLRNGAVAGSPNSSGYLIIMVDGKRYLAHRLIWLYYHGYMPELDVDHINRNRLDNRVENLREVSRSCNTRNSGNYMTNKSGVKGVHWAADRGKWMAHIKVFGNDHHLGQYDDFLEAVCHRLAAEQALNWAGCDSSSPSFQYVKKHLLCSLVA